MEAFASAGSSTPTAAASKADNNSSVSISIILFYKYHPLSSDPEIVEVYRNALDIFCSSLQLKGRILVGCNQHQSEGINGTLSGETAKLQLFVKALMGRREHNEDENDDILQNFWKECQEFYKRAKCPPLTMEESEFKWSHCQQDSTAAPSLPSQLFPDLNIKIVKELIGTGGVLAQIPLDELHQGYLTPKEWHERVLEYNTAAKDDKKKDTILIDCRNTKECQIGHFEGAVDPQTTSFNQFTQWVKNHQTSLENKKVLMYCTGGIRCEKASAYIRRTVPNVQEVRHLKGGIHKYLEEFGSGDSEIAKQSMWKGKNFVFDGRGAHGPPLPEKLDGESGNEARSENSLQNTDVVGACRYCCAPYDTFDPHCVCTVCREPMLVCRKCQDSQAYPEYHCKNHQHLQECYFTNLQPFSAKDLQQQREKLHALVTEIAVGKKFRARRKTLVKQCEKIQERIKELSKDVALEEIHNSESSDEWKCRNCGEVGCSGRCWGFHSLKRKRLLEEQKMLQESAASEAIQSSTKRKANRQIEIIKERKAALRTQQSEEWKQLDLLEPPHVGRNSHTGIRIPKPCTRILETTTKAKWCGKPLLKMIETEFPELVSSEDISTMLQNGLIRVNDKPIRSLEEAESLLLKNMDVVSRVTHWHEPPVHMESSRIGIQKIYLPEDMLSGDSSEDTSLYICNKPSTVPVHPAGPYLSNSMTIMVEAQEGLPPKTLIPCHRIDRVTSGLTLCCTNPQVARLVQSTIAQSPGNHMVRKHYVAKIHGRFPSSEEDVEGQGLPECSDLVTWSWSIPENGETSIVGEQRMVLRVDAPIETADPANGIRSITSNGKPSTSHFHLIEYDQTTNTSIVSCSPLTGRSHQLRVHLQWLGHPIVNDIQYGAGNEYSNVLAGVDAMKESLEESRSSPIQHLARGVSADDEKAARQVCSTCISGPETSFSEAQLLQGGHSICLHAYRYELTLMPLGKNKKNTKVYDQHTVDARVDLPKWAAHLQV